MQWLLVRTHDRRRFHGVVDKIKLGDTSEFTFFELLLVMVP